MSHPLQQEQCPRRANAAQPPAVLFLKIIKNSEVKLRYN